MESEAFNKGYLDRMSVVVPVGKRSPESTGLYLCPYKESNEREDYFGGWMVATNDKVKKYMNENNNKYPYSV